MSKRNNNSGFVYSTNPDFKGDNPFSILSEKEDKSVKASGMKLLVQKSTKHRAGKVATIISGFIGKPEDLSKLEKKLKTKFGVGGSCKESEIIIQGDLRHKIAEYLTSEGFVVKLGN